jgi:hypothetical protein
MKCRKEHLDSSTDRKMQNVDVLFIIGTSYSSTRSEQVIQSRSSLQGLLLVLVEMIIHKWISSDGSELVPTTDVEINITLLVSLRHIKIVDSVWCFSMWISGIILWHAFSGECLPVGLAHHKLGNVWSISGRTTSNRCRRSVWLPLPPPRSFASKRVNLLLQPFKT